jgi:hypothetical protein
VGGGADYCYRVGRRALRAQLQGPALASVDLFPGAHGSFYGRPEKYAVLDMGGTNPFIDPAGFKAHLDRQEMNFMTRLDEQKKAPAR